jgi:hypothetical protein
VKGGWDLFAAKLVNCQGGNLKVFWFQISHLKCTLLKGNQNLKMVNLIEFTLKSDDGERFLFISPVLLQSKTMPSLFPVKAYVYENLIKEDQLAYLKGKNSGQVEYFGKSKLVITHDQDFEKAYLGSLTVHPDEKIKWHCDDNLTGLSEHDIGELVAFLNNYKRGNEPNT